MAIQKSCLKLALFLCASLSVTPVFAELHSTSEVVDLTAQIKKSLRSEKDCRQVLDALTHEIYETNPASVYASREALAQQVPQILEAFWNLRTEIRTKFTEWHQTSDKVSNACVESVRTVLRTIRGAEDYVSHVAQLSEKTKARKDGFYQEFTTAAFKDAPKPFKLKSGDLLLSRGNAFTSAAISRLSDVDGQFSHLTLIYVDEHEEVWTVEAHIELGSVVAPFDKYFEEPKGRIALFRFHDEKVAAVAAKAMFDKVKARQDLKNNIEYDFSLNMQDHSGLFCSEVAREGFEIATQGKMQLPLYPSTYDMKNKSLFARLGITATESFAPSDLEVDPRFEMISEVRNLETVHGLTVKDVIMSKVLSWMDEYGYTLRASGKTKILSQLIWQGRRTKLVSKFLEKRMPLNMTQKTLETIAILKDLVSSIENAIAKKDAEHMQATGFPMSFREIESFLEELRVKDIETYQALQKWKRLPPLLQSMKKAPHPLVLQYLR